MRIMAWTRNGARLEFDEVNQFRSYLDYCKQNTELSVDETGHVKRMNEVVWAGCYSTPDDDQWTGREKKELDLNLLTRKWVEEKLAEFKDLNWNSVGLLFSRKAGLRALASLYNNKWDLGEPTNTELTYCKGSWVHSKWGNYLWLHLAGKPGTMWKLLDRKITQLTGLSSCYTRLADLGLENICLKRQKRISHEIDQWKDLQNKFPMLYSVDGMETVDQFIKWKSRGVFNRDKAGYLCSKYYPWRKEPDSSVNLRKSWKQLISLMKLDIYNASSFACSDLLENDLHIKYKYRDLQHFYGSLPKYRNFKEEFDKRKPSLRIKQEQRAKRELKKYHKSNRFFGPSISSDMKGLPV